MSTQLEDNVLVGRAVDGALAELTGWEREGEAIHKKFKLKSFLEAIAFVNRVAVVAESLNHHPDISIYYRDVEMRCRTHKNNSITEADVALARGIEKVA
jgi:4a-hydroxytetrahydrobiopterin dehydratase